MNNEDKLLVLNEIVGGEVRVIAINGDIIDVVAKRTEALENKLSLIGVSKETIEKYGNKDFVSVLFIAETVAEFDYYEPEVGFYKISEEDKKKLEIANSIEVMDVDTDGEELLYVNVDSNSDNISKLQALGATTEEIEANTAEGMIDIVPIVFDKTIADRWNTEQGFM